jgi:sugar transferase EpsL
MATSGGVSGETSKPHSGQNRAGLHGLAKAWLTAELPEMKTKRILDIVIAIIVGLLSSPLLLVISILIRINFKEPVLFRQIRPGLLGRPFTLFKFRTMTGVRAPDGTLLPDAQRLTRFGNFLRKTSFDELPELINVLRGEMSLVGPRPLLVKYLDRYTPMQMRRHEVLPGITGWAQVNGRNAISWEERFKFDVWYVNNRSLLLDVKILLLTVFDIFVCADVNAKGYATMPEFMGSQSDENDS